MSQPSISSLPICLYRYLVAYFDLSSKLAIRATSRYYKKNTLITSYRNATYFSIGALPILDRAAILKNIRTITLYEQSDISFKIDISKFPSLDRLDVYYKRYVYINGHSDTLKFLSVNSLYNCKNATMPALTHITAKTLETNILSEFSFNNLLSVTCDYLTYHTILPDTVQNLTVYKEQKLSRLPRDIKSLNISIVDEDSHLRFICNAENHFPSNLNLPQHLEYFNISRCNIVHIPDCDVLDMSGRIEHDKYKHCKFNVGERTVYKIIAQNSNFINFPISVRDLDIGKRSDIRCVRHLPNLRRLVIDGNYNNCVSFPDDIEELDVRDRYFMTDFTHLTNLRVLYAIYIVGMKFPKSIRELHLCAISIDAIKNLGHEYPNCVVYKI